AAGRPPPYVTLVPFVLPAEDVIRYFPLTGVQTCALPISTPKIRSRAPARVAVGPRPAGGCVPRATPAAQVPTGTGVVGRRAACGRRRAPPRPAWCRAVPPGPRLTPRHVPVDLLENGGPPARRSRGACLVLLLAQVRAAGAAAETGVPAPHRGAGTRAVVRCRDRGGQPPVVLRPLPDAR